MMDQREWTLFFVGIATGLSVAGVTTYLLSERATGSSTMIASTITVSNPRPNTSSKIKIPTTPFIISSHFSQIEAALTISTSKLAEISSDFIAELDKGLAKDGCDIKAIPSYVTKRPTGNERGIYFALDFGGSNFRVCKVTLNGPGHVPVIQTKEVITEALKLGTGDELFDVFAERTRDFLKANGMGNGRDAKMGFTFSYPVTQTALNKGICLSFVGCGNRD